MKKLFILMLLATMLLAGCKTEDKKEYNKVNNAFNRLVLEDIDKITLFSFADEKTNELNETQKEKFVKLVNSYWDEYEKNGEEVEGFISINPAYFNVYCNGDIYQYAFTAYVLCTDFDYQNSYIFDISEQEAIKTSFTKQYVELLDEFYPLRNTWFNDHVSKIIYKTNNEVYELNEKSVVNQDTLNCCGDIILTETKIRIDYKNPVNNKVENPEYEIECHGDTLNYHILINSEYVQINDKCYKYITDLNVDDKKISYQETMEKIEEVIKDVLNGKELDADFDFVY